MTPPTLEPPRRLDPAAKKEFQRVVSELQGSGIMSVDLSLLADYAQAEADVARLEKAMRKEKPVLTSDKGNAYVNPLVGVLSARRTSLAQLRRDLGFTPRTRGNLPAPKKEAGLRDRLARRGAEVAA